MAYKKYYLYKEQYTTDDGETWIDVEPLTLKPYGNPISEYSTRYECEGTPCTTRYRTTSGSPYCDGDDKYIDVYNQESYDDGTTWVTTYTSPVLIETNSQDCTISTPNIYRWINTNTTLCEENKDLFKVSFRGDGGLSVYPNYYAVQNILCNGNKSYTINISTVFTTFYIDYSIYKAEYAQDWAQIDIYADGNLIKSDHWEGRHSNVPISYPTSGLTCHEIIINVRHSGSGCTSAVNYLTIYKPEGSKRFESFYLYKLQVSENNGETWEDVQPLETQTSGNSLGFYGNSDCTNQIQNRTITGSPYCIEYDRYVNVNTQVSYDGGETWITTLTTPTLIETSSVYCSGGKFLAHYSDSSTYSAFCDSSTVLSSATTRAHSTSYTAMTSAIIGDCVTAINTAFTQCTSLTSVTIPNSIISIGRRAFESCSSLTSITIPNSVKYIGQYAFEYCSGLTSVDIPDSVLSIGGSAFDRCTSLTSCTIGSGVTSIGAAALEACISLTSVVIPSGVTYIDSYAFRFCRSLTSITCLAETPPTLRSQVFLETNNCPIYVPAASVDAYKAAWVDVSSRIQAIP
jgi:hypothetical protein